MDEFHRQAMTLPVIPRIEFYFKSLRDAACGPEEEPNLSTTDELLLLVAQKLVRDGEFEVQFKSHCNCYGRRSSVLKIELDDDGDMIQDHNQLAPRPTTRSLPAFPHP